MKDYSFMSSLMLLIEKAHNIDFCLFIFTRSVVIIIYSFKKIGPPKSLYLCSKASLKSINILDQYGQE